MAEPVLETRNLCKSFGALMATDDVSLTLLPGEIHAVIGPNGAGKSTLIAQICGGLAPDTGSVRLFGRDVTRLPVRDRARAGLARTFQVSTLAMEDTALQNTLLGAIGAAGASWHLFRAALDLTDQVDRARAALARVGLAEVATVPAAELSHGQRRQLEVAIALTLAPRMLVMDEPMAGLGTDGSGRMTRLLQDLRRDIPVLLVEHDMDAVFALADRITVLDYGQVIATGSVDQIRADPQVRTAYLGEGA